MGRQLKSDRHRDWINFTIACRPALAEAIDEHMPGLYAYLGKECGWSPSEMDKHSLAELVRWGNECSRMNERASPG